MVRSIIAVVLGALLAGVTVAAVEFLGQRLFPPPPGLDFNNREAMMSLPTGTFVFLLLAWALGALAGGWLAARLAPRKPLLHGMIVGALLMAGGVMNLVTIPHPVWVTILGLLVFLPAAYMGASLARPRPAV